MGGEYIDSIAKTDLASWSEHEWATLIEVVVTAFQDHLRERLLRRPTLLKESL